MSLNFLRSRSPVAAAGVVCLLNIASATRATGAVDPVASVNIFQGTGAEVRYSRGSCLPMVGEPWAFTDWALQTNGDAGVRPVFHALPHITSPDFAARTSRAPGTAITAKSSSSRKPAHWCCRQKSAGLITN